MRLSSRKGWLINTRPSYLALEVLMGPGRLGDRILLDMVHFSARGNKEVDRKMEVKKESQEGRSRRKAKEGSQGGKFEV